MTQGADPLIPADGSELNTAETLAENDVITAETATPDVIVTADTSVAALTAAQTADVVRSERARITKWLRARATNFLSPAAPAWRNVYAVGLSEAADDLDANKNP